MLFLGDDLWHQLRDLARKARTRVAAVAYVTDSDAVPFGNGDLLVVDASDASIAGGSTSANALARLFERGVRLYSLKGLHAKVYVLDGAAIVGSANLSSMSQDHLAEAALLTTEPAAVEKARRHIKELAARAGPAIDEAFVRRIGQIPVDRHSAQTSLSTDGATRASTQVYVLRGPPLARSKEMRSYLLALICVQTGELRVGVPFRLWKQQSGKKANISHVKAGRFRTTFDGRYELTEVGLAHFSRPDESGDPQMTEQFARAIQTGNEDALPDEIIDRTLVPL